MISFLESALQVLATFPWFPESTWVAISAMVSASVAIATILLAAFTRAMVVATRKLAGETASMAQKTADLAHDTVDASDRADEHHQQTLWPFMSIEKIERFGDSFDIFLRNIGSGAAVRGTVSIVSGHEEMDPMKNLEKYGPVAIQGGTKVKMSNATLINSSGRFPEWIVLRVTFESIFHSTGHMDWMFKMSTGELLTAEYKPPQIMRRELPRGISL